jgi:hypothetical protein
MAVQESIESIDTIVATRNERLSSDQSLSDQSLSDQSLSDQSLSDQSLSDHSPSERPSPKASQVSPAAIGRPWRRRLFLVAGMLGFSLFIWSWPALSQTWIRRQWTAQLVSAETAEEQMESIAGLRAFLPESLPAVLSGLESEDLRTSQFAYQSLDEYLSGLLQIPLNDRRARVQNFVAALDARAELYHPSAQNFVTALASKVYTSNLDDLHPMASDIAMRSERLMQPSDKIPNPVRGDVESPMTRVASNPITQSLSDQSEVTEQLSAEPARIAGLSATGGQRQSLSDSIENLEPSVTTLISDLPGIRSQAARDPTAAASGLATSRSSPEESELIASIPILSGDANSRLSDNPPFRETAFAIAPRSERLVLAPEDGSNSVGSYESVEAKSSPYTSQRLEAEVEQTLLGIEQMASDDVVRLLTSVQPRIVQRAFAELSLRGFSEMQLENLALLANGTSAVRIKTLDALAAKAEMNPLPWLIWMAEEGDRAVRLHAVTLLGSIGNLESQRELRMLSRRERDREVSERISQALLIPTDNSFSNSRVVR